MNSSLCSRQTPWALCVEQTEAAAPRPGAAPGTVAGARASPGEVGASAQGKVKGPDLVEPDVGGSQEERKCICHSLLVSA